MRRIRRGWLLLGGALILGLLLATPALGAVRTDAPDYVPGSTVVISGDNSNDAGYLPGETVDVQVTGPNDYVAVTQATVAEDGSWFGAVTLWADESAQGDYTFTATGQTSAVSESGTFHDAPVVGASVRVASTYNGPSYTVKWSRFAVADDSPTGTPPSSTTNVSPSFFNPTGLVNIAGLPATQYMTLEASDSVSGRPEGVGFDYWEATGTGAAFSTLPGDGRTIKVTGAASGTWTFIAHYADKRPTITLPSSPATATETVAKTFALGSFTDTLSAGPWAMEVDWGDGSTDDLGSTSTTGAIPPTAHTYAPRRPMNGPLGLYNQYSIKVTVTNSLGYTRTSSFLGMVTDAPPKATFSEDVAVAECGQGFFQAPSVVVTDTGGDLSDEATASFAYLYLSMDKVTDQIPMDELMATPPGQWEDLLEKSVDPSGIGFNPLDLHQGLPKGITVDDWARVTSSAVDTGTGTFGGTAQVPAGAYIIFPTDRFGLAPLIPQLLLGGDLTTIKPLVVLVLPHEENSAPIDAAQYTDSLVTPVDVSISAGKGDVAEANPAYVYLSLDTMKNMGNNLSGLLSKPLDQWTLNDIIKDLPDVSLSELSFHEGLPGDLQITNWSVDQGSALDTATGTLSGAANVKAGVYLIFQRDANDVPAAEAVPVVVFPEDMRLNYTGPTSAVPGQQIKLSAQVYPTIWPGDKTYGDITKMWLRFRVTDPFTGAAVVTKYAPVVDADYVGDGVGSAETSSFAAPDGIWCLQIDLVSGPGSTRCNEWYFGLPVTAPLEFVTTDASKSMTGGGWIDDCGARGNFGINARYNKKGQVQGGMLYIWHGKYDGQECDYIIKSNSLNLLTFSGSTYPMTGTFTGKATMKIVSSFGAVELFGKGGLDFTLRGIDTNKSGVPDSFGLIVRDGQVTLKQVGLAPLGGGNITVHSK